MSAANDEDKKPEGEQVEPTPEGEAVVRESAAPAKKKKKKKKRRAAESEAPEGPQYDVTGAERPAFFAWFPADPELAQLVRAFEVGNYALVRERATKLAESAEDENVRSAARELLARIEPDPLMKYLLAVAVALLLFLAFYAYRLHSH